MQIHIDKRGDRVTLRADWRPGIAEECKLISGYSYASTRREWSYPLNMNALRRMREVFGDELDVSEELRKWASSEVRREKKLSGLSRAPTAALAHVPTIAPVLFAAMQDRKYQLTGAAFGARAGSCLFADEPGLGKTSMSLAALMETGDWFSPLPSLIIAPRVSLVPTWARQLTQWTNATFFVMPDGRAKREAVWKEFHKALGQGKDPVFLVINPEMVRRKYGHWCKPCNVWLEDKDKVPPKHYRQSHPYGGKGRRMVRIEEWREIIEQPWNAVILDESHEVLANYRPSNITQSVTGLLDMTAKHKYALTGTPLRGAEENIWGTLDWLGFKTGGFWAYISEYFEVGSNGFAKVIHGVDPARAEALHAILDRMVLRRTRAEVRPDLPLGQRVDVMVDMSPRQEEQYREFEIMGETSLAEGLVSGQGTLSELTRLKQMAFGVWTNPAGTGRLTPTNDSPKLDWMIQFLRKRGITGKKTTDWLPEPGVAYKYVIGSQFTAVVDGLQELLEKSGIKTLKITGDVTGKRRDTAVSLFQSDDTEYRVILLQSQTGGVSIDLDAWCDEMVIIDETWVADDQVQLENRINNRSGRVSPRTWYYLRTAGTIEERIGDENWRQHNLEHKLLDGRRGVTLALHLIRGGDSNGGSDHGASRIHSGVRHSVGDPSSQPKTVVKSKVHRASHRTNNAPKRHRRRVG